jgi:hypothetical protein
MDVERERRARDALQELGLEIADRWASGFQNRPTQQLVLQKIIDPAVRHILSSIFPWVLGVGMLFFVMLICTVLTMVLVMRGGSGSSVAGITAGITAGVTAAGAYV